MEQSTGKECCLGDFEKMTCKVHKGQECISFCLDCKLTVCSKCSCQIQANPKLVHLNKQIEKLSKTQKEHEIEKQISIFEDEEIKLLKLLLEKRKEYESTRENIIVREERIISAAKSHSKTISEELLKMFTSLEGEINNGLSELIRSKENMIQNRNQIENRLLTQNENELVGSSDSPYEEIPLSFPNGVAHKKYKFILGDFNDFKVKEMLGHVFDTTKLKKVRSYQTNLKTVTKMVCSGNNAKLIASYRSNCIQVVTFNESDKMAVQRIVNIKVFDMAVNGIGDIIFSTLDKKLKIFTKDGMMKPYKSFPGFLTLGIHVNKYNEVFVGLSESGSLVLKKDSIRKVVVLTPTGEIKHTYDYVPVMSQNQTGDTMCTYEYARDNERIFTAPWRIVTCQDTVSVIDIQKDSGEGRVVTLDYWGNIKGVYNGRGHGGMASFHPKDITVTSMNTILVSDCDNHAIHVLTSTGQVLVCNQVRDLDVEYPFSLYIDNEGLIWVGCYPKDSFRKAMVHVLQQAAEPTTL